MGFKIPKNELSRLPVTNRKLVVSGECAPYLKVLGVDWRFGDYTIFDYSYYDCLKRNGYTPNLINMVRLHNQILSGS